MRLLSLRYVITCVSLLALGACAPRQTAGLRAPGRAPVESYGVHIDPAGDTKPLLPREWRIGADYRAPDLLSVSGEVLGGILQVRLLLAPSTYDPERTKAIVYVDSDLDTRTGISGPDWQAGADYSFELLRGRYSVFSHRKVGYGETGRIGAYEVAGDTVVLRFPLEPLGGRSEVRVSALTLINIADRVTSHIIDAAPGGNEQPTGWVRAVGR
jgi:hypothetical protein